MGGRSQVGLILVSCLNTFFLACLRKTQSNVCFQRLGFDILLWIWEHLFIGFFETPKCWNHNFQDTEKAHERSSAVEDKKLLDESWERNEERKD